MAAVPLDSAGLRFAGHGPSAEAGSVGGPHEVRYIISSATNRLTSLSGSQYFALTFYGRVTIGRRKQDLAYQIATIALIVAFVAFMLVIRR